MNWIKYIITIPFALCVLFLQGLGKCFGLTYKQISVIFNLWIQGGVLVLSGCLPFVQSLMCSFCVDGGIRSDGLSLLHTEHGGIDHLLCLPCPVVPTFHQNCPWAHNLECS